MVFPLSTEPPAETACPPHKINRFKIGILLKNCRQIALMAYFPIETAVFI